LQLNPTSRYVWFSSYELFGASCEILLSSYPMLIPLNMLCVLSADSHFIPGKEIELSKNVHLRRLPVACRVQAWQALEVLGEMRAEGEEEILVPLASSL
jgi:hypothetical protein